MAHQKSIEDPRNKKMKPLEHLELFITENCNLQCEYCFASNMEKRNITYGRGKKAVDFFLQNSAEGKGLQLSFWGGEPFLVFNALKKLVLYSLEVAQRQKKRILFSIPTNVTLLNNEILNFVQAHNIKLSLSLDGNQNSQSMRKTIEGKSSFPIIVKKLDLIIKQCGNNMPAIRKTVTPSTVKNLYEDIMFFIGYGFNHIAFSPVMEERWSFTDLEIYKNEQIRLADFWIEEIKKNHHVSFTIWDEMFSVRELSRKGALIDKTKFFCGAGSSTIAIDIYGDMYPCHRFVFYDKSKREQCFGSLDKGVTKRKIYEEYGSIDEKRLLERTKDCGKCTYFQTCLLFCPATNYAHTGSIYFNDEQVCKHLALTEQVIDYIEQRIGQEDYYKEYIKNALMRNYPYYRLSQSSPRDVDRIAEKSWGILTKIKNNRGLIS